MFAQLKYLLFLSILGACNNNKQKFESAPLSKLVVTCENKKYLLENSIRNIELSFDTIRSTKSYWQSLGKLQKSSGEKKLFPYVKIYPNPPSIFNNINISLVGHRDWIPDSRLKLSIDYEDMDTTLLINFYKRVTDNPDTSYRRSKAEVSLFFYKDSIKDIQAPLRVIANTYISVQKENAALFFRKELCNLSIKQLDTLKLLVPFRIRLMRNL